VAASPVVASSGPSSSAPDPPPAMHQPHTRSRSGIMKRHEHTDGTVAWLTACVSQSQSDPTTETRHYLAAMHIPHWRAAMDLEIQALRHNGT
jgi:hypothetical protein